MGKAILGGVNEDRARLLYQSIEFSSIALLPKNATANERPSQNSKERKNFILFP
jgi:hypothetical protein